MNRRIKNGLLAAVSLSAAALPAVEKKQDFSTTHKKEIRQLLRTDGKGMANIVVPSAWYAVKSKPAADWMHTPGKGFSLMLPKECDLDKVLKQKGKLYDEIILYNRFTSDRDGIALIGIGCDWWFEAYVNGVLCASTLETVTGNGSGNFAASNNPFFLPVKRGENLLAVRVRRGAASWTFCCNQVSIDEINRPEVKLGPWLGDPGAGKMGIRFLTCGKIGAGVEYRKKGDRVWQVAYDQIQGQIRRRSFHKIHLSGLTEGALYEYRVLMLDPTDPSRKVRGKTNTFRVPDSSRTDYSFFFTADLQFPAERHKTLLRKLLNAADAKSCDFFVFGGDVWSEFSSSAIFQNIIPAICNAGGASRPMVMVRGNHELRGWEADQYLSYFGNENGLSYNVFRFGDTAFLVLDCWEDKPAEQEGAPYCKYNLDRQFIQQETEFLKISMKSKLWTGAKRRIVLAHGAPYSHFDSAATMPFMLQKMTDPYFCGRKPLSRLNLWLAGHTHFYTRSIPGTNTIAAFSEPPRPFKGGRDYVYPVLTCAGPNGKQKHQVSAFRVDARNGVLTIRAFTHDGTCFEKIEILDDGTIRELLSLPHFDREELGNPTPAKKQ